MSFNAYYSSEIGLIEIKGTEEAILSVNFVDDKSTGSPDVPPCVKECVEQIDEYFNGKRKKFTIEIQLQGTDFQKKVWKQLMKIPYGETVSYKDIAVSIGNKKAVRAVGGANNKNKIAIIVPCHRVIGSDGDLVGFGGGLWRKEWLLRHEKVATEID
jgi:methylated-DNA-[protein]-cysteine S-methyltransferase